MEKGFSIFLLLFLFLAAVRDIIYQRVSNRLILVGLFTGLWNQISQLGGWGIVTFLIRSVFPVILLYLLFLMHVLGAGDIKIFSVMNNFISGTAFFQCLIYAGIAAAVWAFLLALCHGRVIQIIKCFLTYLGKGISERRILDYEKEGKAFGVERVPFVPMILAGYLCWLLGFRIM